MSVLKTALFLLAALPSISLAAPSAAGSKHNVYLTECMPSGCDPWDCDPENDAITGAAYFANGPIPEGSGTKIQKPTSYALVGSSNNANIPWEGQKRKLKFGDAGSFTSNIDSAASTATKGSIAGDATLGSEPFVCFKDGTSTFRIRRGGEDFTCTTQYWCPSIDTGSGASS